MYKILADVFELASKHKWTLYVSRNECHFGGRATPRVQIKEGRLIKVPGLLTYKAKKTPQCLDNCTSYPVKDTV